MAGRARVHAKAWARASRDARLHTHHKPMRAAILERFSEPLRVKDVPVPEPTDGEALVRVRAAGLCGTDLKLASGALGGAGRLPLIPGHEIAGELVEAAGGLGSGQRVACYLYDTCGTCRWCRSGQNTLCPDAVRLGVERDGGLAEYVAVPRRNLLPISADVAFESAAVAMDAVTAPWGALHGHGAVKAGESVLVVGSGGLGLNGVQIARDAGARVAVVDPVASHRALAEELGAELAVAPEEAGEIAGWSDGGVDLSLETSGVRAGFDVAVECLRRGGRVVCCGYQPGTEYGLDSSRLVLEEISVHGSRSASREEAEAALRAVESGRVRPPVTERLPLDRVNEALDRLRAREVAGRLVIEP
jgi:D-arabinose 1-dehydrogenase-like Zn-dependent alcohol dehydrogenase